MHSSLLFMLNISTDPTNFAITHVKAAILLRAHIILACTTVLARTVAGKMRAMVKLRSANTN